LAKFVRTDIGDIAARLSILPILSIAGFAP